MNRIRMQDEVWNEGERRKNITSGLNMKNFIGKSYVLLSYIYLPIIAYLNIFHSIVEQN